MSPSVSPPRIDGPELRKIRQRFLSISRARIERVRQTLTPRQQLFVELLPLLFHVNHPLMPGYVTKNAPSGVSGYSPDRRTLLTATKHVRTFPMTKRAVKEVDIYAIYLMGSSGSIGYSTRSDLDVWICYRSELGYGQVEQLREKCHGITRWSASLGLEVHLYPLVAENLFNGETPPLSIEGSGNIQRHFLLDEFYRTSLLVAGRYPLWWLVPPSLEADYVDYADALKSRRFVKFHEFLDFGPVATVPPDEFLSAALWQLFKSIESPSKSLLKVLLLESYAKEYPQVDLLSLRYKSTVYSGTTDLDAVDPYVLLWEKVEDYLQSVGDLERLELCRRCFYSKVQEPLSKRSSLAAVSWRRHLLQRIIRRWGWDELHTQRQDDRDKWKIDWVLEERQTVTNALASVYRTLSEFAHRYPSAAAISARDATLLARKLLIAFEHKPGKVEIISQDISRDLSEAFVSIHRLPASRNGYSWLLFRGIVLRTNPDEHQPLRQFRSLVELLAWCHFNGIITARSSVFLFPQDDYTYKKQVNDASRYLRQCFPTSQMNAPEAETLAKPACLRSAGVLINFGTDPLELYTKKGNYLSSQRADALNYSSEQANLVCLMDYLVVNSWGQVLTQQFVGTEGLLSCLCRHIQNVKQQPRLPASAISYHCWNAGYGRLISQRVKQLFTDLTAWFRSQETGTNSQYILRVGGDFHMLVEDSYGVRHAFSGCHRDLLAYLAERESASTLVTVDRYAEKEYLESAINAERRNGSRGGKKSQKDCEKG
jgi:adenylate cyclase class 1